MPEWIKKTLENWKWKQRQIMERKFILILSEYRNQGNNLRYILVHIRQALLVNLLCLFKKGLTINIIAHVTPVEDSMEISLLL